MLWRFWYSQTQKLPGVIILGAFVDPRARGKYCFAFWHAAKQCFPRRFMWPQCDCDIRLHICVSDRESRFLCAKALFSRRWVKNSSCARGLSENSFHSCSSVFDTAKRKSFHASSCSELIADSIHASAKCWHRNAVHPSKCLVSDVFLQRMFFKCHSSAGSINAC